MYTQTQVPAEHFRFRHCYARTEWISWSKEGGCLKLWKTNTKRKFELLAKVFDGQSMSVDGQGLRVLANNIVGFIEGIIVEQIIALSVKTTTLELAILAINGAIIAFVTRVCFPFSLLNKWLDRLFVGISFKCL